MYEMLKEMIQPELLVLVPVLYLLGEGIKRSEIKDKYIPFILGGTGIVVAFLWLIANMSAFDWKAIIAAVFMAFTQGILCAGASVYINQLVKQTGKEE